jgi:hypothetical protein
MLTVADTLQRASAGRGRQNGEASYTQGVRLKGTNMLFISLLLGIASDKTNTIVFQMPSEFMDLPTWGKAPREGA